MVPRASPRKGEKSHQGEPRGQARCHARHRRRRFRKAGGRGFPSDDVPDSEAEDPGIDGRGAEDAEHFSRREAEGEAVERERGRRGGRERRGGRGSSERSLSFLPVLLPVLFLLFFGSPLRYHFFRQRSTSLARRRCFAGTSGGERGSSSFFFARLEPERPRTPTPALERRNHHSLPFPFL